MTAYAEMDAAQLNEAIYRAQGYTKLDWPAVPRWQKPGGFGLYDEPQYATDILAALRLAHEMGYSGPRKPTEICAAWLAWKDAQP